MKSGPIGGDVEICSQIVQGRIACLIFFVNPMTWHPHFVDVQVLLRHATLYNVPFALNDSTARLLLDPEGEEQRQTAQMDGSSDEFDVTLDQPLEINYLRRTTSALANYDRKHTVANPLDAYHKQRRS